MAVELSSAELADASELKTYLEKAGLSAAGASGVIGNWVQESSLNASDDGPSGLGLSQWMGTRASNEQSYASSQGESPLSYQAQAGFTLQELKQDYPSLLQELKTTTNASQAALDFSDQYERPSAAAADNSNRQAYAGEIQGVTSGAVGAGASRSVAASIAGQGLQGARDQMIVQGAASSETSTISSVASGGIFAGLISWLEGTAAEAGLWIGLLTLGVVLIIMGLSRSGAKAPNLSMVPVPV